MTTTVPTRRWGVDAFLEHVQRFSPDATLETRLDELPTYRRLAFTRWLSSVLERPVDHEVVRRFATVADAWRWLDGALASDERLAPERGRTPGASTRVRLRPVVDADLGPLYLASFDPMHAGAWRFRGRTLPPEEFVATLHDGVRAQYVVELIETGEAVGIVSAYDHHQAGLHCKIAFLRTAPQLPGSAGAVLEGALVLISHLFTTFPYRKIYAELPAYNRWIFEPRFMVEEGVLRDYLFHEGRPVDLHLVSLSREAWEQTTALTGW